MNANNSNNNQNLVADLTNFDAFMKAHASEPNPNKALERRQAYFELQARANAQRQGKQFASVCDNVLADVPQEAKAKAKRLAKHLSNSDYAVEILAAILLSQEDRGKSLLKSANRLACKAFKQSNKANRRGKPVKRQKRLALAKSA